MLRILAAFIVAIPDALLRASGMPAAQLQQGAVSVLARLSKPEVHIADVTATADADVAAVIPHGLGVRPIDITLTQILSQALAAESNWSVGAVDETNVNLVKLNTVGSGNAAAQLRVIVRAPELAGR